MVAIWCSVPVADGWNAWKLEMRRAACLTPLKGVFEINGLHIPTWKNGRWGNGFSQRRQGSLGNAPNSQVCITDRDVFGSAGGCWWEGVNTWAVCCRRNKFPLAPQLGGSLPPAKTRMVRRPSRSSVLIVRGRAGREVTESSPLSLGWAATSSIFFHPSLVQRDKEGRGALLHQLETPAGGCMDPSLWCFQVVDLFKKKNQNQLHKLQLMVPGEI